MAKLSGSCLGFFLCLILGASCLVIGLVLVLDVFPDYIDGKIRENLVLRNGTDQANRFVESPVPIYFKFYIFNITNKEAVINGEQAELQELGPYVYREEKYKEVSSWDEAAGVIRYKERRTYFFEPSLTKGDLSDQINHVNPVAIAIAAKLDKIHLSTFIPYIGKNHTYVETHTVEELIFSGYSIKDYFPWMPINVCRFIPCTFAFYYGKNHTTGKEYEVSSGVLGMSDYTNIKLYNDEPELPYWYADSCNSLNGTDGQQFPPGIDSSQSLYVFTDDLCRSLRLDFVKDVTVEGIDALQYQVPQSVFADPNINKDNMCFCQKYETQKCPSKAGVIPLYNCQDGNPVAASAPHFYQGEPEYWQRFKGLNPNKEKHDTFLNIEPMTGQVIEAAKRLQVNVHVKPDSRIKMLPKILHNDTYFPVFWIEEGGKIDPDNAADFRKQLATPYKIGKWSLISVTILGGVILLTLVIIIVYKRLSKPLIPFTELTEETAVEEDDKEMIDKTTTSPQV